ncbi:MAG TPA: alpha/beta hydrolase-fold protein [Planctomycetota bacterium]|nr:alpha/beta hydrolase-fold protein [Planctomycetota bacterium]
MPVIMLDVESSRLRGNPLGDPSRRQVPVYLPPGYDSGTRRYPTVWVLSGFTGTGRMLLNVPSFDEPLAPDRFDRLIAKKAIPPVIAVLPDCSTRFGGSQYLDSAATGPYMSHVVDELAPEVDRRFRTIPRREARAVLGKSSGGFGALVLAMEHPEVFSACASHSGDCYFEYCYGMDFPKFVRDAKKRGGLEKFLTEFPTLEIKDKDEIFLVNLIAMAQSYSPNGNKAPLNFDLPFDLETGQHRPDVFARWKAWDPVERAALRVDALRSLRALYLDAGDRDEFWLDLGAKILSRRLTALGVEHVLEEFKGGHFNIQARYDRSLPAVCGVLETSG